MPDYSVGKIYKIINPQNETIYIGSTIQTLSKRFCRHNHKGNGNKIILLENYPCNSREELNKKEQELIEQYDNLLNQVRAFNSEEYNKKYYKQYNENNKNELSEKAKVYYEKNKNKITEKKKKWYENNKEKSKVYRQEHRDKILENRKIYYEENKNKLSEKTKIKFPCECGCQIRKDSFYKHKKSKKHIKLMETK